MNFWDILLIILALLVMFVGLVGIFFPFVPGIILIFGSLLFYGILTGFREITVNIILIFLGLTVFTFLLDYLSSYFGVKKVGGTKWGMLGAVIGTTFGLLSGGLAGLLLGSFLGAVLFEYLFGKNLNLALKSGTGAFIGFLAGSLIKFIIGLSMVVVFIWRVVF